MKARDIPSRKEVRMKAAVCYAFGRPLVVEEVEAVRSATWATETDGLQTCCRGAMGRALPYGDVAGAIPIHVGGRPALMRSAGAVPTAGPSQSDSTSLGSIRMRLM